MVRTGLAKGATESPTLVLFTTVAVFVMEPIERVKDVTVYRILRWSTTSVVSAMVRTIHAEEGVTTSPTQMPPTMHVAFAMERIAPVLGVTGFPTLDSATISVVSATERIALVQDVMVFQTQTQSTTPAVFATERIVHVLAVMACQIHT